jgi:hypothetical protein
VSRDFCATWYYPANFPEGTGENQETSQYGFQISETKLANQSMEEFIRKPLQADGIKKDQ